MIKIIKNRNDTKTATCTCGTTILLRGTLKYPFNCPNCGKYYNHFGYELEPETIIYIKTHPDYYGGY